METLFSFLLMLSRTRDYRRTRDCVKKIKEEGEKDNNAALSQEIA